ncbi:MAG: hypothetical protein NZ556_06265 [Fimbriimonadales bacterium]|nr:hypothetical protein [Fimbriimonadales bacterium]
MTLETIHSADTLYERLRAAGLDALFVREVLLPDWWDDSIAAAPAGLAEMELRLARALGVSLKRMREGIYADGTDVRDPVLVVSPAVGEVQRHWLALLTRRVGELALRATATPYLPISPDASALRKQILEYRLAESPSLVSLLNYCWGRGVPVLCLPRLPQSLVIQGYAVATLQGRPTVVAISPYRYSRRLRRFVAEAIGYIALKDVRAAQGFAESLLAGCSADAHWEGLPTIQRKMRQSLDWSQLTEEETEILLRLTGGKSNL